MTEIDEKSTYCDIISIKACTKLMKILTLFYISFKLILRQAVAWSLILTPF